jgi:hypothetical protein
MIHSPKKSYYRFIPQIDPNRGFSMIFLFGKYEIKQAQESAAHV